MCGETGLFSSNIKNSPSSRSLWTRAQSYPKTLSSKWTIEIVFQRVRSLAKN